MISRIITSSIIAILLLTGINFPQMKSMQYGGKTRSYKVHLPPEYDGSNKLPLVLVFNGWTHSPDQTEAHTKMSIKADSAGFIVVYPAGIAGSNKEWNHDGRYSIDDVGFIKELIDTLIKDYSVDNKRIYASGFSNGAGMAYRMAYELPDRIAAIAPVAQTLLGTKYNPKRATPTIHFHAKNDQSVAYSTVGPMVEYWKTLTANVTGPDTFFITSGAKGIKWTGENNTEFIVYVTDIGGHSWPGGNPSFATPSQAISASDLLWDFFAAHPLDTTGLTGIENGSNLNNPHNFELYQNYPNPFNPSTVIGYQLSVISHITLKVYDVLGNEVATLVDEQKQPGYYQVKFSAGSCGDGSYLSSGVYLYRLDAGEFSSAKKFILMK